MAEKKEKGFLLSSLENFWYYYKWPFLGGIVIFFVVMIAMINFSSVEEPSDASVLAVFARPLTTQEFEFQSRLEGVIEDADGNGPRSDVYEQALEPQPYKRADVHLHEPFFQALSDGRDVHGRVVYDHTRGAGHDALRRFKYAHDDRPGVRDDEDCARRLEHPLEKDGGLYLVEVVPVRDDLDKLQRHDYGENDASDGENDGLGERLYHIEDVRVPVLRRLAYLPGDARDVLVDVVKEAGEIGDYPTGQYFLYPLGERVFEQLYAPSPPAPQGKNFAAISRIAQIAAAPASCR